MAGGASVSENQQKVFQPTRQPSGFFICVPSMFDNLEVQVLYPTLMEVKG